MKPVALLTVLASTSLGHYFFPATIVDGVRSADWQYIRETASNPTGTPHRGVYGDEIRCNEKPGRPGADVQTVAAGSRIGFSSSRPVNHPGPYIFWLARVPDDEDDVDSWVPSGDVWFKIGQYGANPGGQWPPFESEYTELYATIPKTLQPGNYLLRVEQISLLLYNEPHFHISCAQINVNGTGTRSPEDEDLVSFPGAYPESGPSWAYPIFGTWFPPYVYPGPAVWQ